MASNVNIEELFESERTTVKELIDLAEDKEKLVETFRNELMKKYNNLLIYHISFANSDVFSLLQDYTKTFLDIAANHLLYNMNAIDYLYVTDHTNIYTITIHYNNKVWQEFTFDKRTMKLENVRVYFYKYNEVVVLGNVQAFNKLEALARIVKGVL